MTLSVTSQAPASPVPAKGPTLVVGLGVSGQAIARHLSDRGIDFAVADTRSAPPGLENLREHAPQAEVHLGPLEALDLSRFGEVVLSPGIDPRQAVFDGVRERLVGEIALFVHRNLPTIVQQFFARCHDVVRRTAQGCCILAVAIRNHLDGKLCAQQPTDFVGEFSYRTSFAWLSFAVPQLSGGLD